MVLFVLVSGRLFNRFLGVVFGVVLIVFIGSGVVFGVIDLGNGLFYIGGIDSLLIEVVLFRFVVIGLLLSILFSLGKFLVVFLVVVIVVGVVELINFRVLVD